MRRIYWFCELIAMRTPRSVTFRKSHLLPHHVSDLLFEKAYKKDAQICYIDLLFLKCSFLLSRHTSALHPYVCVWIGKVFSCIRLFVCSYYQFWVTSEFTFTDHWWLVELPMWLTDGFSVTFFGRWRGQCEYTLIPMWLPYMVINV